MSHRRHPVASIALAATLLLGACSGESDPGESGAAPTAEASGVTDSTEDGATPQIADSPVGRQAQWVLDQLAAEEGPSAEEATERFAPEFLAQVPADQLESTFDQLRAAGPFELTSYQENGPGAQAELADKDGQRYLLTVGLGQDDRMAALTLTGLMDIPEIASLDDAVAALSGAGDRSAFLWAEVSEDGSACIPVVEDGPDQLLPIGSIFKLYVLGAVVRAVED